MKKCCFQVLLSPPRFLSCFSLPLLSVSLPFYFYPISILIQVLPKNRNNRIELLLAPAERRRRRGRRQPHHHPFFPRLPLDLGPELPLELQALLPLSFEALGLDGGDPEIFGVVF
jgi:hypothetical protein